MLVIDLTLMCNYHAELGSEVDRIITEVNVYLKRIEIIKY